MASGASGGWQLGLAIAVSCLLACLDSSSAFVPAPAGHSHLSAGNGLLREGRRSGSSPRVNARLGNPDSRGRGSVAGGLLIGSQIGAHNGGLLRTGNVPRCPNPGGGDGRGSAEQGGLSRHPSGRRLPALALRMSREGGGEVVEEEVREQVRLRRETLKRTGMMQTVSTTDRGAYAPGFVEEWNASTPQRYIYENKLPRDRWVPLPVPASFGELGQLLQSDAVRDVLQDSQRRNYWIYASGRTLFFFLSSFANALLQIRVAPTPNPIEYGKAYRKEVAAALKRVAMSGSRRNVVDSSTRIPSAERVRKLFGSIFELYRRDCQNVFYGVYRSPYDASLRHRQFNLTHVQLQFERTRRHSVETGVRRARGKKGMFEVRDVLEKRGAGQASGVVVVEDPFEEDEDAFNDYFLLGDLSIYPQYYLQNFHWQTDGWLSTSSAKTYEYTTETLFSGVQDAMQRAGFVSVSEFVSLRRGVVPEKDIRLLEVACGTGRLHTFIKDNWPEMQTIASDLSPYYLQEAQENLKYYIEFAEKTTGRVIEPPEFVQCRAESTPFVNQTFDIVTCTYLFHEIPPPIRHQVATEMLRILKPGGIAVVTDSFQKGDTPDKDHVGALFPANYHEPFYLNYFEETDLVDMFCSKGFVFKRHQIAHLSKVLTFEKPAEDGEEPPQRPDEASTTLRRGGGQWAIV